MSYVATNNLFLRSLYEIYHGFCIDCHTTLIEYNGYDLGKQLCKMAFIFLIR